MRCYLCRAASLAALMALAAGCGGGGGSAAGEVSGTVTYKGEPVPAGTVSFHPQGGSPVATELSGAGEYRVQNVPPGPATVTVSTAAFKNLAPPPKHLWKDGKPPAGTVRYVAIPPQFEKADSSTLKYTVERGAKVYNITLD